MSSFIPADQLSFDQYKASLKAFLLTQERFKDYDFEGSNLSVLIDLLSYNAFNQAHYLNMVGSEMFLDTAQLRHSIVSRAKELNYVPRSRVSARVDIVVEVAPGDSPTTIIIPKYYSFKSTTADGRTIRFNTDQPVVLTKDINNRYISDTITVYEGVVVEETFTVVATSLENGTVRYNQRFNLQSENVDANSIEITVYPGGNLADPHTYNKATTLYGLSDTSKIFFVRGYKDNYYEVEFGDGVLGAAVSATDIIKISYRNTVGAEGNGNYTITKGTSIDGYTAITVTTLTRSEGGSERETNDSIKYNAVRHFQVQDRAVTESDYKVLIETNFPEIQQVNAYGGELVSKYGKVIIVLKPYNSEGVVDEATKLRITNFIKTKSLVPQPLIEDPEYYYLGVDGNVYYNANRVTSQINMIEADVVSALTALNATTLSTFNTTVYQSHINSVITSSNAIIVGSDVVLSMIRKLQPVFGVNYTYSFTTNNTLKASEQGTYSSADYYGIQSNVFDIILDDVVSQAVLQDDGVGLIHLYKIINGVKVKQPVSVGTVDYDTGAVTFTVDLYLTTPNFKIKCLITDNSLTVDLNKFITADGSDINLNMVAR